MDINEDWMTNNGMIFKFFSWHKSSMFVKLTEHLIHQGRVKSDIGYYLECEEARNIIGQIEKELESYVRYEYEPEVPNCRTICGKLIIKADKFIKGTIE
jgi:hypothetical protein